MAKEISGDGRGATQTDSRITHESDRAPKLPGRRRFIAGLGAATAAVSAGILSPAVVSAQSDHGGSAPSSPAPPAGVTNKRIIAAFGLRVTEATQDALAGPAMNVNNGDTALYADKGGTYTKGLPHDNFGRVDLNAFASFTKALNSGEFSDFEASSRAAHARKTARKVGWPSTWRRSTTCSSASLRCRPPLEPQATKTQLSC